MSHTNNNTGLFGNLFGNADSAPLSQGQKTTQSLLIMGAILPMALIASFPERYKWAAIAIQMVFLSATTFHGWKINRFGILPFVLSLLATIAAISSGLIGKL